MKQNYYTAEEAMAVLEPRIREMFKDREEAKEQETRTNIINKSNTRKGGKGYETICNTRRDELREDTYCLVGAH